MLGLPRQLLDKLLRDGRQLLLLLLLWGLLHFKVGREIAHRSRHGGVGAGVALGGRRVQQARRWFGNNLSSTGGLLADNVEFVVGGDGGAVLVVELVNLVGKLLKVLLE